MRQTRKVGISARLTSEVERALTRRHTLGEPGRARGRKLARGAGWSVDDVVCNFGPGDQPFEERHADVSVSLVVSGTFQYRTARQPELLVPGSLLLGNVGQCFECSHHHAAGDRCLAFSFTPDYFEQVAADAGAKQRFFRVGKLPPLRALSSLSAAAIAGLLSADANWHELSLHMIAEATRAANGFTDPAPRLPRGAETRVTASVRAIEHESAARVALDELAARAGLSPYHYLRVFERVTGVTPHQFVLRTRLREAATRLKTDAARVVEIAFATGFGDLSNFNRAFRAEFGVSPRRWRAKA